MAYKTLAQLQAEITANITTNGAQAITGAVLNTMLTDMKDSLMQGPPASTVGDIPIFANTGGQVTTDSGIPVASLASTASVNALIAAAIAGLSAVYQPLKALLTSLGGLTVAAGDLIIGTGANVLGNLGIGANGSSLVVSAGAIAWGQPSSTMKNRLINGGFNVNQRVYVSAAATAVGTYMHDRWKSNTINTAYTFAGNLVDTVITITAGTIVQIIENLMVEGGTYTLSWSGTATARWAQGATAAAALAALGGAFGAGPQAVTSITAGNFIAVEFSTGTLTDVQLEPGAAATSFEKMPFDMVLERCNRYYEKSFPYATAPAQNAGFVGAFVTAQTVGASLACNYGVSFKVKKRAVPTMVIFNPQVANAQIRNVTGGLDFTGSGAGNVSENGFVASGTSAAATTAGQFCAVNWTAEAEL